MNFVIYIDYTVRNTSVVTHCVDYHFKPQVTSAYYHAENKHPFVILNIVTTR